MVWSREQCRPPNSSPLERMPRKLTPTIVVVLMGYPISADSDSGAGRFCMGTDPFMIRIGRARLLLIGLGLSLASHTATPDVIAVVSSKSAITTLSKTQLADIFLVKGQPLSQWRTCSAYRPGGGFSRSRGVLREGG